MVTNLLEDAENEIHLWKGGSRLTDPLFHQSVVKVECDMVIRAAQLAAKTTMLVPQIEDIDRTGQGGTAGFNSRPPVYLSRYERRTLGLKLTGSLPLYPTIPDYWADTP
jgi:hypothetical protein